jgi:tyrosyl-tRNA synthetase
MSEEKHLVAEMTGLGLAHSRSEARRVIAQGGVQVNGKRILRIDRLVETNDLIQVGKNQAARVE